MKTQMRIYIDTSVFGGCFDEEFEEASIALIKMVKNGELKAVISEITRVELKDAPNHVREVLDDLPNSMIENVDLTPEAAELANDYIAEQVLVKSKLADAQHIAIATINKVDLIVSWNFRHHVNINRIRGFNAVNLKMGYILIDIRSPWEVISY